MTRPIAEAFEHCPRCGAVIPEAGNNPLRCPSCGYTHFFGPCTAVAGIVVDGAGDLLFIKRQRDPHKGKLGIPGGFVDAGETLEHALTREVREEVGLTVQRLTYLTSFPNSYAYSGVMIPVTDMFFVCDVDPDESVTIDRGEIADWMFATPGEATLAKMAFESNVRAVRHYLEHVA